MHTTPDEKKAEQWSNYYASGPHLAGKNLSQALWTQQLWQSFGVNDSSIAAYDIYVNYPKHHRVALLETDRQNETKIKFEAKLEEDVLDEDTTSGLPDRIPTFHGYSASGNVTAQYVYVNYGVYQDFEDLVARNVSLEGKIGIAKYGSIFRGLKVKRAQELGMIGMLIYTDPGDDGDMTEEHGHKPYPHGPARQPSSVQRGSVQFLSFAPGDPTTPGYPSLPGAPRESNTEHALPTIPSIPISYTDALPLLLALNGHGPSASSFNKYWQGGGLAHHGVTYNIGPSPANTTINLVNEQEYVTTPMWNVIGIINGTLADEVIILGNHRDAWIAGGAGDPNSGSAALNEVVRSFGVALGRGWRPLRTVVFASWDGEEYGLIGSTEWVEQYLPWLSRAAVAYLNVDVAASGTRFHAAAAPLLDRVLTAAARRVASPNQTTPGQSVADVWDGTIHTMGSGSDFTAFQDFAGVPCVDIGFQPGPGDAVYHYHSNYDSLSWMAARGDPGYQYHVAAAKLWGLLAAKLVQSPVIMFSAVDYAKALGRYVTAVEAKAVAVNMTAVGADTLSHGKLSLHKLHTAVAHLHTAAEALDAEAAALSARLDADDQALPWYAVAEKARLYRRVRAVNTRYKYLERQFLHPEGLDGRPWFKHTVFAPGLWTGYAGATFPGLMESLDARDEAGVERWQGVIAAQIWKGVGLLRGEKGRVCGADEEAALMVVEE